MGIRVKPCKELAYSAGVERLEVDWDPTPRELPDRPIYALSLLQFRQVISKPQPERFAFAPVKDVCRLRPLPLMLEEVVSKTQDF